jgi:hypothetical protein
MVPFITVPIAVSVKLTFRGCLLVHAVRKAAAAHIRQSAGVFIYEICLMVDLIFCISYNVLMNKFKGKKYNLYALITLGLIVLIVIVCIFLIIHSSATGVGTASRTATIYQNGIPVKSIDLSQCEAESFTIYGEGETYNTIEVKGGEICVVSASCPDKICVRQGFTGKNSLLPVTCLPNRVVIVVENAEEADADAITY